MDKKAFSTDQAPAAVGPYSQAIQTGNLLFLSGQLGLDPSSMKLVEGGVLEQAKQIFKNIKAVLTEAGASLENVVKATVYLKDMADFKKVNEIYATQFTQPFPARTAIAAKDLPLNADIEIEIIAAK